jgi:hypothetical protein
VKSKGWSEIDNGVNIGTCGVAVVKICIIISVIIFFERWQDCKGCGAMHRALNSCRGNE